jgi:hypothetical protein
MFIFSLIYSIISGNIFTQNKAFLPAARHLFSSAAMQKGFKFEANSVAFILLFYIHIVHSAKIQQQIRQQLKQQTKPQKCPHRYSTHKYTAPVTAR